MKRHPLRLSRPVYEALPWLYLGCGLLALLASYLRGSGYLSAGLGVVGFLGVTGGLVVLLRRRDFRDMRTQYADPEGMEKRP